MKKKNLSSLSEWDVKSVRCTWLHTGVIVRQDLVFLGHLKLPLMMLKPDYNEIIQIICVQLKSEITQIYIDNNEEV